MSLLPIVERELRAAGRRPRTHRIRVLMAFVGIAIGAGMLGTYALADVPQAEVGRALFQALSGLAFIHCLFAGRLATADSISAEKREGTLGLLFLTDLKGYDIVLGKLFATSLNSFYGLLALLPVLAVPLLLGGMTTFEFARMALVLVSTFILSLAIGICASAFGREARDAYGTNLLLILGLVALLPWAVAWFLASRAGAGIQPGDFFLSPAYAFFATRESLYAAAPDLFWGSLGVSVAWTLGLLGLASRTVPRTWQEQPAPDTGRVRNWRGLWRRLSFGHPSKLPAFRKRLLDVNGFHWLTSRARLKPAHVWGLIFGAGAWWLIGWWLAGDRTWLQPETGIVMALILNSAFKMWIAIEAGHQLCEDRRSGAMELLLVTPLTIGDVVKGQLLSLRRQFLAPLLAILVIEFGFMVIALQNYYETRTLYLWLAGMTMLVVDSVALIFTAMAAALTAKNAQQMIARTFNRILVLPWIAFWLVGMLANVWVALGSNEGRPLPWGFNLAVWVLLGLLADLVFGLHGARVLFTRFRALAGSQFDATRAPRAEPAPAADARPVRPGAKVVETAPRPRMQRRRWAMAAAIVVGLLAWGGIHVYRELNPAIPGPVTIKLPHGKAADQLSVVSSGGGFFLILPDGSLWRWGWATAAEKNEPMIPQMVPGEQQWRSVRKTSDGLLGLRLDGTLWRLHSDLAGNPKRDQIGTHDDWQEIFTGQRHHAAIKKDGTLWMWGDNRKRQLGMDTPAHQPDPIQVGTNRNWKQIVFFGSGTLGLQDDGSIWFWGEVPHLFKTNTGKGEIIPAPVRYCLESNWTSLATHWGALARSNSGDWHALFYDRPDSAAGATNNTRVVIRNAQTADLNFGLSLVGGLMPAVHEVRPDGTLWQAPFMGSSAALSAPTTGWQRFDTRTDWIRVWSNGSTMLGLTADGTLWMWGIDPTIQPGALKLRLDRLQARLFEIFGANPRGANFGMPPLQTVPRPLIKFVPGE